MSRCLLAWLFFGATAAAFEPAVLLWQPGADADSGSQPPWVATFETVGGTIDDAAWRFAADAPVGFGQIDFSITAAERPLALALTLAFAQEDGVDLALNLYNATGELVGVDLFGNLAATAKAGRTDTFIVPLSRYPSATRVSLRRMRGPLALYGLLAFPVVTAPDSMSLDDQEAFARFLGERLAPGARTTGSDSTVRVRESVFDPSLQHLLADPVYPTHRYHGTLPKEDAFPAYVAGTCYRFFTHLYLPLFGETMERSFYFTSSGWAVSGILERKVEVTLSSYPPSNAELDAFAELHGFRPMIIPIGRDAVEILVHPDNQLEQINFPRLRALFSEGARQRGGAVTRWQQSSELHGPVIIAGGDPTWGTSRFFADKVLGQEELRHDLFIMDVVFPNGVERFVAENRNTIGFAQHTRRVHPVKALGLTPRDSQPAIQANALTVADGSYPLTRHLYLLLGYPSVEAIPEPVLHFADRLLSRSGQEAVAAAGSFALAAEEVREARTLLGLDD